MPDTGRSSASSLIIASVCAFAIIAMQVAGKATRDVLFLTSYHISSLPLMLMASALLSIGAVLLITRILTALGPARVIPSFFLASGMLLIGEWLLAMRNVRIGSVIVYFHVAVIGSILVSGFWSMVNEHFDPRSARQNIGRIGVGAAVGGLFGGFLADRIGSGAGVLWLLPVIAAFHVICALLLPRLTSMDAVTDTPPLRTLFARPRGADESGFRVLARVGYLRNLALIVLLGNVAATLIDFLFKARATESFPGSADLMHFFAAFYTIVSVATLAVQAGVTRRLLERTGVADTMAVRPAVMTVGGLLTLPFMGVIGLSILRGVDAVFQSSVFRSGYELLFTPVVPDQKRRTKTLIDVGADRMGDILGGGIVRAVILLPVAVAGHLLVVLTVVVSVVAFVIARALRRGYLRALEERLLHRAGDLDMGTAGDSSMRTMMMESFTGIDLSGSLEAIRTDALRAHIEPDSSATTSVPAARTADRPSPPQRAVDPEIVSLVELRSGDAGRVRAELRGMRSPSPAVAAQIISLLAWDEITGWASRALAKAAPRITGQLIDRLLDPDEDFAIRRRIPRILAMCVTPRAVDGLLAALSDKRFEVRFQVGRALARIHEQNLSLSVSRDVVYGAVMKETNVGRPLWEDQRLLDEPAADDPSVFIDEALRTQTTRSMEHVFTLLSLVLPAAPLRIAFKGLLTTDPVLRGTSLEYLESALPRDIWENLHPFLNDRREHASNQRPGQEILEALLRSSQSIEVNLSEIRKRVTGE